MPNVTPDNSVVSGLPRVVVVGLCAGTNRRARILLSIWEVVVGVTGGWNQACVVVVVDIKVFVVIGIGVSRRGRHHNAARRHLHFSARAIFYKS